MVINDSGQYWYDRWIWFVIDAIGCLDKKQGTWKHIPSEGGYYDQDEIIMDIWEAIKIEYKNLVTDEKFMETVK